MEFILIFLILLVVVINNILKKNYFSPIMLFSTIWMVVIGLYSLKLFNIYSIHYNTVIVLLLGIIGFIIGCIISKLFIPLKKNKNISYSSKKITIFMLIILILSMPFYLSKIPLMLKGACPADLKMALVTGETDGGGILTQYIVRPFEYICIAISAYYLIYDRNKKINIYIGLIMMLFRFLFTGSKVIIVFYFICIAFNYFEKKYIERKLISEEKVKEIEKNILRKNKYILYFALFALILFFVNYTIKQKRYQIIIFLWLWLCCNVR